MASRIYKYKQLTHTNEQGKRVKAWHKPISLVRKVGDLTCEGCYFERMNNCALMVKANKLPSCTGSTGKRSYIFVKVINY